MCQYTCVYYCLINYLIYYYLIIIGIIIIMLQFLYHQILFLLGPAAVLCLLTVLGYGYHNDEERYSVQYLKQLYMFKDKEDNVFLVSCSKFVSVSHALFLYTKNWS